MRFSEVISELAEKADLTPHQARKAVDGLGEILAGFITDERETRLDLGKLGRFQKVQRNGRKVLDYRYSRMVKSLLFKAREGRNEKA